jgi:hypothetical protein
MELEAAKVARQKERETRTPRTNGWLFKYNPAGEIEQVLMDGEPSSYEATVPPKPSMSILGNNNNSNNNNNNNKFASNRPTSTATAWQSKNTTREAHVGANVNVSPEDDNADGDNDVQTDDRVSKQLRTLQQKRAGRQEKSLDKASMVSKNTKVSKSTGTSKPQSRGSNGNSSIAADKDKKWERVGAPSAEKDGKEKPPLPSTVAATAGPKKSSPRGSRDGTSKSPGVRASSDPTDGPPVIGATLRDARKSAGRQQSTAEGASKPKEGDGSNEAGNVKGKSSKPPRRDQGKQDTAHKEPPAA